MLETVVSINFPVEEKLQIRKQRILPEGENRGRISIVTGTHGDELEGQYVCYELSKRIKENISCLKGTVDIYPALNPMGIDSIERGIPGFDLDMNRIFPGKENGSMMEHAAAKIVQDLSGSDMVIDIHASNLYLTEIPQVRINEHDAEKLVPLAQHLNIDFIWVHSAATVLEATLAHSLNSTGTPCLVVEMGIGLRLTQAYGEQLISGIFSMMKHLGIWDGETDEPRKPLVSTEFDDVAFLNAEESGVFIQKMSHNSFVRKGQLIGEIVSPLEGKLLSEVISPCDGLIFTLRDFPMVVEGSLVGRILNAKAISEDRLKVYEERGNRPVESIHYRKLMGGAE